MARSGSQTSRPSPYSKTVPKQVSKETKSEASGNLVAETPLESQVSQVQTSVPVAAETATPLADEDVTLVSDEGEGAAAAEVKGEVDPNLLDYEPSDAEDFAEEEEGNKLPAKDSDGKPLASVSIFNNKPTFDIL